MATIRDIAKIAKVSVGTVSRYLSGSMKVKPGTAARIDQAVKDTNYVRNYSAAAIKTKTSHMVALAFPSMQSLVFGEIAEAISNTLTKNGYILTTATTGDDLDQEKRATEKMREQRVAGAIFVTEPMGNKDVSHLQLLEQSGIKTLVINRFFEENELRSISVDFHRGIDLVVEHLKEEGYKKLGLISGWPEQNQSVVDSQAMMDAAKKYGLEYDKQCEKYMYYKDEMIHKQVEELVVYGVDALVVISDRWAIEVMDAVEKLGLRVPEDIAVVGMGNTKYAKIRNMTSLDIKLKQLGEEAAETLLACIRGDEVLVYQEIEPSLVVRSTTKRK
jgi:LacI family transcriptional regulator